MTDHPDLARLLKGILASPEEDGPRLAWADRLAELGDGDRAAQERAEFVRVQVELAGLPECYAEPNEPTCREGFGEPLPAGKWCRPCLLRRRERELLAPNWSSWVPRLPPPIACGNRDAWPKTTLSPSGGHVVMTFRRGFVESVTMPAASLTHLDAVRACHPVTAVTLTTLPRHETSWPIKGPDEANVSVFGPGWVRQYTLTPRPNASRPDPEMIRAAVRMALAESWHGIAWTLPPGQA